MSHLYILPALLCMHTISSNNLLFIMFDDLRPDLNCMGRSHMITPNFDRLAHRSVVFDNAFAQISVCNPSRDSLMTGLRPDTVGTYGFQESFRPHVVFPTHLARVGYNTAAYGIPSSSLSLPPYLLLLISSSLSFIL